MQQFCLAIGVKLRSHTLLRAPWAALGFTCCLRHADNVMCAVQGRRHTERKVSFSAVVLEWGLLSTAFPCCCVPCRGEEVCRGHGRWLRETPAPGEGSGLSPAGQAQVSHL